ncbi:MAG TPA: formyltransferase family protein [Roseiflexaceae bacterium]|nr:formyltransferase family protein [Roseiflexaceae bacterium]
MKQIARHYTTRLLFFGMASRFWAAARAPLGAHGMRIGGGFSPAPPQAAAISRVPPPRTPPISLADSYTTPADLAHAAGVPVFAVARLHAAEVGAMLAPLMPDLGCIACFPRRLPEALFTLPPGGCYNLHPSLLPAYRGPAPRFWIMRDAAQLGVTIHRVDAQFDHGPILAQQVIDLPDGVDGATIDTHSAVAAATLFATRSAAGIPLSSLRPQPAGGSAYPAPAAADFRIDTTWGARRAFNFMRATADWGQPYPIGIAGREFQLQDAISYETRRPSIPIREEPGRVRLQLADGALYARFRE